MPSDHEATERWLLDIHHHIAMVEGFVAGVPYDEFKDDNMRLYAAVRCLEIISEASRRLPPELKQRHPSVSWRDIPAAGNIYRHEYEDVEASIVWQTITHGLPSLRSVIVSELAALDGGAQKP